MHFWELSFTLFFRCSRCWSSADFLSFYSKIFLSSLCLEYIEFLLRIRCIFLQMTHQNIWLSTVYIIDLSGHIYNIRMCTAHSLPYRGGGCGFNPGSPCPVISAKGVSVLEDFLSRGLCPGSSLSRGESVQRRVCVQRVSAWGVSVWGSLSSGESLSRGKALFRWSLSGGSLSREVSV